MRNEAYLFGHGTSFLWWIENLIVKHWEVECQPQPYRVCWRQISQCNILQTRELIRNYLITWWILFKRREKKGLYSKSKFEITWAAL